MALFKIVFRRSLLAPIAAIVLFLSPGCGEEQSGYTSRPGNGSDTEIECYNSTDCTPPLICLDFKCINRNGDNDEDEGCRSNFDCPVDKICDTETGRCVSPLEDGDEEGDPDEDIEEIDEEEIEPERDEEEIVPFELYFIMPADGQVVDGLVEISVAYLSDIAIDEIEIYAGGVRLPQETDGDIELEMEENEIDPDEDGGETEEEAVSPFFTVTWDTTGFDEGAVEIKAVAVSGENRVEESIDVIADHSDPTVDIISPEAARIFHYYDQIEFVIDAGDNLRLVELWYDDELMYTFNEEELDDTRALSYSIPASDRRKGVHTLAVYAEDKVGSHGRAEDSVSFIIDEEGPEIWIGIGGSEWRDPGREVEILAETPFTVHIEDVSGLSNVTFVIKDQYNHNIYPPSGTVFEVSDFPLTVHNHEIRRHSSDIMYPVVFNLIANGTDNYDNISTFSGHLGVKRLKWTYDSGLSAGTGYQQKTGAAVSEAKESLYFSLDKQLQSLSRRGLFRWSCIESRYFLTTPVVAEADGFPTVVIAATSNGTLVFRIDDEEEAPQPEEEAEQEVEETDGDIEEEMEESEGEVEVEEGEGEVEVEEGEGEAEIEESEAESNGEGDPDEDADEMEAEGEEACCDGELEGEADSEPGQEQDAPSRSDTDGDLDPDMDGDGDGLDGSDSDEAEAHEADEDEAYEAEIEYVYPDDCLSHLPMTGLAYPSAPAVGDFTAIDGGFELPLYYCTQKGSDSVCMKIFFRYTMNGGAEYEREWTLYFNDASHPTSPVVPRGPFFTKLSVGVGNKVIQIDRNTGALGASRMFNLGQIVNQISANPVGKGLYVTSDKEFHIYKWDLVEQFGFTFGNSIPDRYMPGQMVSDRQGYFIESTLREVTGQQMGVVTAYSIRNFTLYHNIWEFRTRYEGLIGGTPAIGQYDRIYMAGQNQNGNIWAFDMYAVTDGSETDPLWQMQIGTGIYAPLLITPWGDLVVVGLDLKVRTIDILGDGPDSTASWPMFQGSGKHTGHYDP